MKKLTPIIILISLIIPTTANAANLSNKTNAKPTIAILDTALDSSMSSISSNIIYEACVLQWNSCPNGSDIMEGKGSAYLPLNIISANGFDHGTQMTYLSVKENPSVNIVFVRIIGNNPWGTRQVAGETTLIKALDWVIANKDKFNIQAVSMSQGHHNLLPLNDYCPKTPNTEARIKTLKSVGVPVFLPAGNNMDYKRLDWPACIPDSVAIGATMPYKEVAVYSNYDPLLIDFFALGTTKSQLPNGTLTNIAGTSAATIVAATQWATIKSAKPELTYQQVYDLISRTATITKNSKISGAKLINLTGALNG